jgi:Flp pilus assembly protein TadD
MIIIKKWATVVLLIIAMVAPVLGEGTAEGVTLYNESKYDEAIKAYDEAIRLAPNLIEAWNNKGMALDALGKTTEANAAKAKAKELGYSG